VLFDEKSEGHSSRAEAHADSIAVLPGINPRPAAPEEFFRRLYPPFSSHLCFGTAEAVPFQNTPTDLPKLSF
jgi:hypothetical protein